MVSQGEDSLVKQIEWSCSNGWIWDQYKKGYIEFHSLPLRSEVILHSAPSKKEIELRLLEEGNAHCPALPILPVKVKMRQSVRVIDS
jgi:hypothetical protein